MGPAHIRVNPKVGGGGGGEGGGGVGGPIFHSGPSFTKVWYYMC